MHYKPYSKNEWLLYFKCMLKKFSFESCLHEIVCSLILRSIASEKIVIERGISPQREWMSKQKEKDFWDKVPILLHTSKLLWMCVTLQSLSRCSNLKTYRSVHFENYNSASNWSDLHWWWNLCFLPYFTPCRLRYDAIEFISCKK